MVKRILFLALLFILGQCQVSAVEDIFFTGFISDNAGILSEDVKNDLNMTLWDLQKKSGADIAVVTLTDLNGQSVEDAALEIGRKYKIGAAGKNNGVVFLTAINDRKMRFELGRGLENKIDISTLVNIRDKDVLPYYRLNDYESGISRGTYILAQTVANADGVNIKSQGICPEQMSDNYYHKREKPPFWVYILAIILAPFRRRRRFDSSGFGGFGGGGGFGGCGCSGSW